MISVENKSNRRVCFVYPCEELYKKGLALARKGYQKAFSLTLDDSDRPSLFIMVMSGNKILAQVGIILREDRGGILPTEHYMGVSCPGAYEVCRFIFGKNRVKDDFPLVAKGMVDFAVSFGFKRSVATLKTHTIDLLRECGFILHNLEIGKVISESFRIEYKTYFLNGDPIKAVEFRLEDYLGQLNEAKS